MPPDCVCNCTPHMVNGIVYGITFCVLAFISISLTISILKGE